MPRVNFVKKARKDVEETDIKKGDSYYWWKFRFGEKHTSKTPPKQSQLTQSEFLGQIYDIQDRISELTTDDDFENEISDIVSELESLIEECEDRRSNMPEQLQDSGSGEMLQNRADSVQEMIDELEGINIEIEDDIDDKEEGETQEDYEKRRDELKEEKKQEILDEIQNVSYNGE